MTDKIVALSNNPQQISVTLTHQPGPNIYERMEELAVKLNAQARAIQAAEAQVESPGVSMSLPDSEDGS
jgi:hypothetical protein